VNANVRKEAAVWCAKLAEDRAKDSWSIRFTQVEIDATEPTKLAWRAFQAIKAKLGDAAPNTPPRAVWLLAEKLLLDGWPMTPRVPSSRMPPIAKVPKIAAKAKPAPLPSPPPVPTIHTTHEPMNPEKEITTMAKKQTRRSISLSGKTFDRIQSFAENKNISMSQLAEVALLHMMDEPCFVIDQLIERKLSERSEREVQA